MEKLVSIKSIDKIISQYKTKEENNCIIYHCDDSDICIDIVSPDYIRWSEAISSGVSIICKVKEGECLPEIYSLAFGYSLIKCFTNIKTDNIAKVMNLIIGSPILKDLVGALRKNMFTMFKGDFEKAYQNCLNEINKDRRVGDLCEKIEMALGALDDVFDAETVAKLVESIGSEKSEENE